MTMELEHTQAAAQRLRGIALCVWAIFLLSVMDVLIKLSSEGIPTGQIVFFRSVTALVPITISAIVQGGGVRALRAHRPGFLVLRGVVSLVTAGSFFTALALLPLIDVYAIGFSAPLMITALSALILAERVGWRRWTAIIVGLAGVLVALRPGRGGLAEMLTLGAVAAFAGAFGYALIMIMTRIAGRTDQPATIVFYGMLVMTVVSAMTLPFAYVPPDPTQWVMLITLGLVASAAHLSMAMAYRQTEASVLAPFEYTALIWGLAFGWAIWSDLPDAYVIAGSVLIIGSGLYVLHREARRGRQSGPSLSAGRTTAAQPEGQGDGAMDPQSASAGASVPDR